MNEKIPQVHVGTGQVAAEHVGTVVIVEYAAGRVLPEEGAALVAGGVVLVIFPGRIFHQGPEKGRQQVLLILERCTGDSFLPGRFLFDGKEGAGNL